MLGQEYIIKIHLKNSRLTKQQKEKELAHASKKKKKRPLFNPGRYVHHVSSLLNCSEHDPKITNVFGTT